MDRALRCMGWAGALAFAAASCGPLDCAGRADAPSPSAAVPVSAEPRSSAPALPPEPAGLEKLAEPAYRQAVIAWAKGRHGQAEKEGARLRWSIESARTARYNNVDGGYAELIVRERVERAPGRGARCEEVLRVVRIELLARRPEPEIEDRQIGLDCCRDACDTRPPFGWMLDYVRAVERRDVEALAQLVGASGELSVILRTIDEGERDEETFRQRAATLRPEIFDHLSPIHLESHSVCCDDAFGADGMATCSAYGGGWEAHYTWKRAGNEAHLREVREKSH